MSAPYVSDAERKLWSDTGYICERDYPRVERLSATVGALLDAIEAPGSYASTLERAIRLAAQIRGAK